MAVSDKLVDEIIADVLGATGADPTEEQVEEEKEIISTRLLEIFMKLIGQY